MGATMLIPRFTPGEVLPSVMARVHSAWMKEAGRLLEPWMRADGTFWARWAAVNYLSDQLPERLTLEQALLRALDSALDLEVRNRLWNQANRVMRLHAELHELNTRRPEAIDLARTTRLFLEALRLWYAEIELAVVGIRWDNLSARAKAALDELAAGTCDPWLMIGE